MNAATAFKNASWDGSLGHTLSHTADIWDDQVAQLVRSLRDIHTKCTNTAANYERTERENMVKFKPMPKNSPFG